LGPLVSGRRSSHASRHPRRRQDGRFGIGWRYPTWKAQKAVLEEPVGTPSGILPTRQRPGGVTVVMVVSRKRDVVQRLPWLSCPIVIPSRFHSVERYPSGPWQTR
jgi:hypothetical protein